MTIQFPDPKRNEKARTVREKAAFLSTEFAYANPPHNYDEKAPYLFSFTKGLAHGLNGLLIDLDDFVEFADGTKQSDPAGFSKAQLFNGTFLTHTPADFKALACPKNRNNTHRQWESPTAGHAYVLEGPDPYAVNMPLAPRVGSNEFVAEMAEVYQMALSRDWPVANFMAAGLVNGLKKINGNSPSADEKKQLKNRTEVAQVAARLSDFQWFQGNTNNLDTSSGQERNRRRCGEEVTESNVFRGAGEDGWDTPFLSQFMVMGTGPCTDDPATRLDGRATGRIQYGAQTIDQKVRIAQPEQDYMLRWADWLDVQNALNKRALVSNEFVAGETRFMSRLRDLATYVHDDQLYQAYLNAALIMLGEGHAFDPGIPYHNDSHNAAPGGNREPFALFGGPHLLTLVTEVSSRALKAVRLQKFSVHRRLRPEAAAALFHTVFTGYHPQRDLTPPQNGAPYAIGDGSIEASARDRLAERVAPYTHPYNNGTPEGTDPGMDAILKEVRVHNKKMCGDDTWLLPMAFPEGSPMHPAYGAGHATVAGACVTLLKAFFSMSDPKDGSKPAYLVNPGESALVPSPGKNEHDYDPGMLCVQIPSGLTLEGELNKLMWNISNARNIAGVHYYTDYIESALLGEAITIGILREQMLAYEPAENVSMTVPLLVPRTLPECLLNGPDGMPGSIDKTEIVSAVKITSNGTLSAVAATPGRGA